MKAGRFRVGLLSILIIISLMTPVMTLLSVGPASAKPDPQSEYYFIIRGEEDCWNEDVVGVPPWKNYDQGSYPPLMVAKKVGDGAVIAAGIGRMCNGGPTYPTQRWTAGELDVLLDVAFRWMTDNTAPSEVKVIWYGKYIGAKYEVYNDSDACAWLIDDLRSKGYRVDSKWDPFTPTLLEPYDILVIPQIQAGDRTVGGDPDMIDDAEVDFIKDFVEGGGGLLLMDGSDATGYCFNAVQNKFLRALDFTYLFQHDAVKDPETGEGYEIRYITAEVTDDAFGGDYRSATDKTTITLYRVNSLAEPLENVEVRITPKYQSSMPSSTLTFSVMVTNTGKEDDDYALSVADTAGWEPGLSEVELLNLGGGKSEKVTLTISIPADATMGAEDSVTVTATSTTDAARRDSDNCIASAARRITPPIDDTYTHAGRPETNFGRLPDIYTGWYQHPTIGTGGPERTWLKFDLSVLPADTTIDKAELRVYNHFYPEPPEWGSYGVIPYRVDDDDWTEGTMTWNNQPVEGAELDDPKEVLETGWYSWDVTSFVQEEFGGGGDKKVSFCLKDIGEDTESNHSTWFASKEYDDYSKWAYLYIPLPYAVDVSIKPWIQDTSPGETLTYTVIVTNVGTETDSYSLSVTDTLGWAPAIGQTQFANVPYGESENTTLTVTIPGGASLCTRDTITVTATGTGVSDSDSCIAHAFEGAKLPPTDDAHVSDGEEYQNSNFGDENTLDLQSYTRFYMNERIFLKFDLSTIPSGSTITEAEVWLWSRKAELTDINAQCWSVRDDTWSEDLITWGTQPLSVAILDTVALKYSPPSEDMWLIWNVTEFVRNEFADDEKASFGIRAEVESATGRYRFNSKEWPGEDKDPHLKISYTTIARSVGVDVSPDDQSGSPGATLTYTATIVNEGDAEDTYDLTVTDTWSATVTPTSLKLDAGASGTATLTVTIPDDAAEGDSTTITVTASGTGYDNTSTARATAKEKGLPMTLIAIVVIVVVVVVVVALVLMRGRRAAPTWTS